MNFLDATIILKKFINFIDKTLILITHDLDFI